ncbi:hypothetical protein GCM10027203_46890 [Nonomuraea fastidiosa]
MLRVRVDVEASVSWGDPLLCGLGAADRWLVGWGAAVLVEDAVWWVRVGLGGAVLSGWVARRVLCCVA